MIFPRPSTAMSPLYTDRGIVVLEPLEKNPSLFIFAERIGLPALDEGGN